MMHGQKNIKLRHPMSQWCTQEDHGITIRKVHHFEEDVVYSAVRREW